MSTLIKQLFYNNNVLSQHPQVLLIYVSLLNYCPPPETSEEFLVKLLFNIERNPIDIRDLMSNRD